MKVFVFDMREYDELGMFNEFTEELGFEMGYTFETLVPEIVDYAKGYEFVSVLTTPITAAMLDRFKEIGVRMIGTRCIGYDHIDIAHAKEIGITVTNITYEIDGVAEFTVMGMLMAVRRIGEVHARTLKGDFRLEGMLSRQLKDLTVGIVGAGKIGQAVMRDLSGFGCRVLYSNRSRKAEADKYGEYVPFDELLDRSDIVSIHLEYMRDTHHMFDSDTIGKMKDGSILVNTSRGGLVDTKAMIDALESGKLSSAVLDVVEGEFGRYYYDCSERDLSGEYIDILRKMDNVIFTHHMGFYYRKAVSDMVYNCLLSMKMFAEGKDIPHRLA